MTIGIGDKIPAVTLCKVGIQESETVESTEYFKDRVVLFAVPGAFTPVCSAQHLPGYIELRDEIHAQGVARIACMAVNDAFVMSHWGAMLKAFDKVDLLADGSAIFTKALGLELDLSARGMGIRSQRFALIIDDGVLKDLALEKNPGALDVSSAQSILERLEKLDEIKD